MNSTPQADSPSVRQHKRQFVWQILVPFVLTAVLIIVAAVFIMTSGASNTRVWADVSTLWLILPILVLSLILVTVLSFLIYGVARLLKVTPKYTGKTQAFLAATAAGARKVTDGTAMPFIWIRQAGAVIKSIFKH
jgi:uncharacterized BrkB/YihY/UPF0761 family membrane protein